jgi:hypothetical protein
MNRRRFLKILGSSPVFSFLHAQLAQSRLVAPGPFAGMPLLDVEFTTSVMPKTAEKIEVAFSRNAPAFVEGHHHVLLRAGADEIRFQGARRVENLLPHSEDFTRYAGNHARLNLIPGVKDPLGSQRATTVVANTAGGEIIQRVPAIPGHRYVNAVFVRMRRGRGAIAMLDPSGNIWTQLRAGDSWQRFSLGPTMCRSQCAIGLRALNRGDAFDIAFAQIEDVTDRGPSMQVVSEYVSRGVLTHPYHGACVDGVRYFDTDGGNTLDAVTHAVRERSGYRLPDAALHGALLEGARENLCRNFNLTPESLAGVSASGGELRVVDDAETLFADGLLNTHALIPYPALRAISNGKVFRLVNKTDKQQVVTIAGGTGTGRYSASVYARSTDPSARFCIGNSACVPIDANPIYNNSGVYARFTMEGVETSAGEELQFVVPPGATLHFIANQLEAGSFCSSLMEVRGEKTRRDSDVLVYAAASFIDMAQGTALLKWRTPSAILDVAGQGRPSLLAISGDHGTSSDLLSVPLTDAVGTDNSISSIRVRSLFMALKWDSGGGSHLFVNGSYHGRGVPVAGPPPRRLALGQRFGAAPAFGTFRDLTLYRSMAGDGEITDGFMTAKKARVIFDDKQIPDFYASETACDHYAETVKAAGFNVVMPLVWKANGTRYRNSLGLPIDYTVAKSYQRGFDGLAYLIQRCHDMGIEVHPVFNVTRTGWSKDMAPYRNIFFDDPRPPQPGNSEYFNIHKPTFRQWISDIVGELVERYDIDGLCFDYLRAGIGFYASEFNESDYRKRYGRDLRKDSAAGVKAPGVRLQDWNREDIEDILQRIVPKARRLKPGLVISNAGLGQCQPGPGPDHTQWQGQFNVDWVNAGMVDYIIPWEYAHPIPHDRWDYKNRLRERRRGTVMGGLYHGQKPVEPIMLHSIMPAILADDGDMQALYPYWTMSQEHIRILREQYFHLPARIPWRRS